MITNKIAFLLKEVDAAGKKFYRLPVRRGDSIDDIRTNELLTNILSDVDNILNNWETHLQPRDEKANWLRDILGN